MNTGVLYPLGEQMQWTLFSDDQIIGGYCVLPGGRHASFLGGGRPASAVASQALTAPPASDLIHSRYIARHLGPMERNLHRTSSGRVVIEYGLNVPTGRVTATFETSGGEDLGLLTASEHLMDDLIVR